MSVANHKASIFKGGYAKLLTVELLLGLDELSGGGVRLGDRLGSEESSLLGRVPVELDGRRGDVLGLEERCVRVQGTGRDSQTLAASTSWN